jgi:hypothetical protein
MHTWGSVQGNPQPDAGVPIFRLFADISAEHNEMIFLGHQIISLISTAYRNFRGTVSPGMIPAIE